MSQLFDEPTLATLQGHLAIGHTRYSTTGGPAGLAGQLIPQESCPAQLSTLPLPNP